MDYRESTLTDVNIFIPKIEIKLAHPLTQKVGTTYQSEVKQKKSNKDNRKMF